MPSATPSATSEEISSQPTNSLFNYYGNHMPFSLSYNPEVIPVQVQLEQQLQPQIYVPSLEEEVRVVPSKNCSNLNIQKVNETEKVEYTEQEFGMAKRDFILCSLLTLVLLFTFPMFACFPCTFMLKYKQSKHPNVKTMLQSSRLCMSLIIMLNILLIIVVAVLYIVLFINLTK